MPYPPPGAPSLGLRDTMRRAVTTVPLRVPNTLTVAPTANWFSDDGDLRLPKTVAGVSFTWSTAPFFVRTVQVLPLIELTVPAIAWWRP